MLLKCICTFASQYVHLSHNKINTYLFTYHSICCDSLEREQETENGKEIGWKPILSDGSGDVGKVASFSASKSHGFLLVVHIYSHAFLVVPSF